MRKTSFQIVMGNSPRMKVIDFLIENDRTSWDLSELRQSKIGYSTLKKLMPQLLKLKLVYIEKEVGKMKFYKINNNSTIINKLYALYNEINNELVKEKIGGHLSK